MKFLAFFVVFYFFAVLQILPQNSLKINLKGNKSQSILLTDIKKISFDLKSGVDDKHNINDTLSNDAAFLIYPNPAGNFINITDKLLQTNVGSRIVYVCIEHFIVNKRQYFNVIAKNDTQVSQSSDAIFIDIPAAP